jgi:cytochrome d ubiquinol oxidase subunit II
LVSPRIFAKWFAFPEIVLLAPVPLITAAVFLGLWKLLGELPKPGDRHAWLPFAGAALICLLGFAGLAYSFYPYVVPDQLTVWQAASAPESLVVILIGAIIVLPLILAYTLYAYTVFRGKAAALYYD